MLDNSKSNSFYSADESAEFDSPPNAVQAVIHEMQIIVNGSIVKLRLSSDINLQGTVIPKNTFLYGMASLKGERLEVKVDNIQFRNSIFPVELTVYDLDGISGIYIPGAINRDVAKASAIGRYRLWALRAFQIRGAHRLPVWELRQQKVC